MAAEGGTVAVLDINATELEKTRQGVEARGARAVSLVVDVSVPDQVRDAVARTESALGPIDVLVSNAGVPIVSEIQTLTLDAWDRAFAVNTRSSFVLVQTVLARMRERRTGVISITASSAALVGEVGSAPYAPSKAALVNFSQQVAAEHAQHGIRCNCVCPGWVDTPFNDPAFADDHERRATVERQVPLGREGTPHEIAAAISFLCSDDAAYITGHTLVVDGGLTLGPR
ncbi:SDR family NAD(P)-dependent oxidoreductase [Nocardioides sp. AN3]